MTEEHIINRPTVVCYGTSITRGVPHVSEEDTYPAVLQRRLNRKLKHEQTQVSVVNSGVPGENTAEGLARIDGDVLGHDPALTVIEFACNDVRYEPEKRVEPDDFDANLREMIDRIQKVCTEIIVCTPTPIVDEFHVYSQEVDFYEPWDGCNNALLEYDEVIREVVADRQVVICDLQEAYMAEAVRAEFDGAIDDASDLTCIAHLISRYDGVHPTIAGQELIASEVYRIIRSIPLG